MKGYTNYITYIAISQGCLNDKYRVSEFRTSSNITLFGNRIKSSVLCKKLKTEAQNSTYLTKYEFITHKNTKTPSRK